MRVFMCFYANPKQNPSKTKQKTTVFIRDGQTFPTLGGGGVLGGGKWRIFGKILGGGILRQDGGRKWRPEVPFSRLLKGLGG